MYNDFDPDRIEVSGPFNTVRMEGEIHGIKKVVTMFMDVHMSPNAQTVCSNVYSKDINKYLAESFYELNDTDRMYDFFLEIYPSTFKVDSATRAEAIAKQGPPSVGPSVSGNERPRFSRPSRRREKYIWQALNLVKSAVKYDAAGDRVSISDIFKNVRLHYLDIREILNRITADLYRLPIPNMLPTVFQMLGNVKEGIKHLCDLYQVLRSNPNIPAPNADPLFQAFAKSIHKVLYSYKHTNVQEVITKRLDRYFGELNELGPMIDGLVETLQHFQFISSKREPTFIRDTGLIRGMRPREKLEIFADINLQVQELQNQSLFAGVGITDCYLLRRLLDKDYVTNAITYTGGSHTINYISILAGDFGFKVTNVSFTRASSIPELNSTIADRLAKGERITDLFVDDEDHQCSDLTDFPKRFL